ncbi:MAG: sigma-70 family RNA polymerase sigma factor [Candidatus Aminicenantes bacterium]|nr:sigma-70 family RNA polymerase sigma factor [Candidatus Aminicenantes bacterium]
MDDRKDEDLVVLARSGRPEAFMELVRRHRERIFVMIYGMTRDRSDAEDLTQETFLAAYRALGRFRQRSSFYTWVYRIAVNLSLNFLKKRGRERDRMVFDENLAPADPAAGAVASPEETSAQSELEAKLAEAVEALPPLFKAAFLMVANQGLSHAEAARILGCTENTVSWRMHKARKLLRARMRPFLSEVEHEM